MATLAAVELSHDFRIGQTTGTVEFFSMTWTAQWTLCCLSCS